MICGWTGKVDRYVDSELSDADSTEMRAHLLTCHECAAGALDRLQTKRMVRAGGTLFRPSLEFRAAVEQSLGVRAKPRWSSWWVPAFATVPVLALVALGVVFWLQHSRVDEQSFGELADLHISALASPNPVDVVSTDRHTVKPWFEGKLPFTFNLPELQNTPFKLIGGRLTYFQQSPGAQLLFAAGKHQISVFIFQNRGAASRIDSGFPMTRKLTFGSETWSEGGLRYFVVGDVSQSDLHELSLLLK